MYVLVTDSAANLPDALIDHMSLPVIPFSYEMGGETFFGYEKGKPTDNKPFYDRMRQGETASTAQITSAVYTDFFEPFLKQGMDVLYIGFSSALSGSFNNAVMAAQELRGKYPGRSVVPVDSLSASLGQGLLVYYAMMEKEAGKSLDELARWVEENRLHLCHWFTVDDLVYLKRGGRISAATALMGAMLGIKPILHVDDEGRLVSVGKVRGRRNSVAEMFARMKETCVHPEGQTIFIGHGDCEEDARLLESMVRTLPVKDVTIGQIDAVIGAHSGPGTLALFFLGSRR